MNLSLIFENPEVIVAVNHINFTEWQLYFRGQYLSKWNHDSDNPIHMLEGARRPWVQLAHPDGGDDGQVGAEQVVVADPDEVAEPMRLG